MTTTQLNSFLNLGLIELSAEDVAAAEKEAASQHVRLKDAIVRLGLVREETLLQQAAEHLGLAYTELADDGIEAAAVQAVPAGTANHYHIMPFAAAGEGITIATDDPFNEDLAHELSVFLGRPVQIALAPAEAISRAIRRRYGVGADTVEAMVSQDEGLEAGTAEQDLSDESVAHQASVIKLVNQILIDAIRSGATDLHFEPYEDDLRVRYRCDGVLLEAGVPPMAKHFRHAIVSRIKIISNLDVAERRLPQDGRAQVTLAGETYDLRVSILPTPHGEAANIRVLPRTSLYHDLRRLGIEGRDLDELTKLVARPHGIILVTGPTGSGKTTTLYTCLNMRNEVGTKIITIEDPIEYRMRGLVQMQVSPSIGFTFARALRSMLRHDPDVMLVGEIRDLETAEITIRTALTGHLVFSTLHTNDAATATSRLLDMGIEPFLIASSVLGILAQRLVRLICPACKEAYRPDVEELAHLNAVLAGVSELHRGQGCRECRFTGYRGRTAVSEMMIIDDAIRKLIAARAPSTEIEQAAREKGTTTLWESALSRVIAGQTTLAEALRVTAA